MSSGEPQRRRSWPRRIRHRVRPWINRPIARLAHAVLPPIYMAYMRFVFATSRVEDNDFRRLRRICDQRDGAVALLWHEEVFTVAYGYGVQLRMAPHTLASAGDAGELITRVLERCGFVVFRGGSTRHRSRRRQAVLLAMVRHMQTTPRVLYGITVDGSKGPAYRIKPGAIVIAAKCGRPVALVRTWYRRMLRLPTWDRTAIPLPFNRIACHLRGPYDVPPEAASGEALEQLTLRLEDELIELAEQSYDEMGQRRPPNLRRRVRPDVQPAA